MKTNSLVLILLILLLAAALALIPLPGLAPGRQAKATPFPSQTPAPNWMICTGLPDGFLNVRSRPGATAPTLGVLPEAAHVTPTGQRNGDWLQIRAPLAGWVHSKFICEVSP